MRTRRCQGLGGVLGRGCGLGSRVGRRRHRDRMRTRKVGYFFESADMEGGLFHFIAACFCTEKCPANLPHPIKMRVWRDIPHPSSTSPTETLLRLLLPLSDKVH